MSTFWGSSDFYSNLVSGRDDDNSSELEVLVHAYLRDVHYTSRRKAILNVVYSTFNVGLVALPLVAEFAGIPLFVFAVILVALSSGYTTCMVISMANEQGVRTLEDLAERAFGLKGFVIVCLMEIIFSMSLMCVTLDVWADISTGVLNSFPQVPERCQNRFFGLFVGAVFILPICLYARSMSSLRFSSYFSVIAIVVSLCCLIVALFCNTGEGDSNLSSADTFRTVMEPKPLWWILSLVITFCFANNQVLYVVMYCCVVRGL